MLHWLTHRLWPVIQRTWNHWQEDDGFLLSAAMAYYAAFSLFPLCLVLISILGFVMRLSSQAADAQKTLLHAIEQSAGPNAGPWLASQLQTLLAGVQANASIGGPLGILALLIAAIGVFYQLDYMFGRIWESKSSSSTTWLGFVRTALYDRLTAFLMLLFVGGLLVALFLSNLVLSGVRTYVVQMPGGHKVWTVGQLGMTILGYALLMGIVYKMLPRASIRWSKAMAGGLFVSIIWLIGQRLLVSFVIGDGYTAYGVVGSFIAIMLWAYYASAALFLGAEFVQALSAPRDEG